MTECKVLIGQKIICDHLRIGKKVFYKIIDEGAPIIKTQAGWRTHADILDEYFRGNIATAMTKVTAKRLGPSSRF